ncbi:MAG: SGNH/GDSL hydrolase family protein [Candidatus Sumerlaeota bacterium]|nr:SGNH/GDSL hydrolase family protein [Candidatus Sumerlaeota bacterium]
MIHRRLFLFALGAAPAVCALRAPLFAAEGPVFAKDARILFQGDSITDGNRGRNLDPNHILGHGYCFIIAAKYGGQFPERNLTFLNRGVSGNKVTDLQKRWTNDTLTLKPDYLSILIGVNDASSVLKGPNGVTPEEYEKIYDQLLAETLMSLPKIRFVLCEPFILPVGKVKDRWEEYNADIKKRQEIVARLAAKYKAPFVRFQKVFDDACKRAPADYWIWDGVHPTYSGHQLMADEWTRTVEQFWQGKQAIACAWR